MKYETVLRTWPISLAVNVPVRITSSKTDLLKGKKEIVDIASNCEYKKRPGHKKNLIKKCSTVPGAVKDQKTVTTIVR